ncbi:MAG: YggU family protein [Thermoplasmata archaeon]|nr:MAG: YggU family protein [Thermoplasmata archaeon]
MELKDWRTALREIDGETVDMDLYVEPGASSTMVGPYDPWRQRIKVRVTAPAEEGKANAELLATLADLLGIGPKDVHIARGATTRRKTVRASGVALSELEERFASVLGEGEGQG